MASVGLPDTRAKVALKAYFGATRAVNYALAMDFEDERLSLEETGQAPAPGAQSTLNVELHDAGEVLKLRGLVERSEALPEGGHRLRLLVIASSPGYRALVERVRSQNERRMFPRFPERVRIAWLSPRAFSETRSRNIGEGGCLLEHHGAPVSGPGQEVLLRLHLPSGDALKLKGLVIHELAPMPEAGASESDRASRGTGISFSELLPGDQRKLARFLDRLAPPAPELD